jgi:hypothetical protein
MEDTGHGLIERFAISMSDGNDMILMQAKQHLRIFITQIIDKTIVEAAIACTRIERYIRNL